MSMPLPENKIQAVADELLQHDVDGNMTHTCLCGDGIWSNGHPDGNTSMARHRAINVLRVLAELELQESVQEAVNHE